ncbi:MAG: phospholipase effector Tle1 domain-containing protein, partial [Paracoccaceae bacterium]
AAIPDAIAHYRARGPETHPNSEVSFRFRLRVSPHLVTSTEEEAWRRGTGGPDAPRLRVAYLGVWDTVGALGLPGVFGALARRVNRQYAFHDADLSRMVASARHAVALDERRRLYPPTLWENLDALNGDADPAARCYLQHWFPGNHGIVGGSGPAPGLGAAAALWIAEGAAAGGLAFEPGTLETLARAADPLESGVQLAQVAGPGNLLGLWLADRDGPDQADDVSATARARVAGLPSYRPASLRRVRDALG